MRQGAKDLLDTLDLGQLMATIPSGLFLVDRRQTIVFWNAEAERITGYRADESIGRHCSILEGIECDSTCRLFDENVPKPAIGALCRIKAKDGRQLYLLKNVDLLRNEQDEVIGGIESFNDVTELQEVQMRLEGALRGTEEAVRERTVELDTEREWLRTVLDTMVDFAYICSEDFTIQFMNRAMIEALGDHLGEKCFRALYQREEVCNFCPMSAMLEGEVVRQERVFMDPQKTYEVIHAPLRSSDGSVQKLSVFRDITDRKHYEQRLESANRELDAFVYTVSHDLRTPLTPIIGYAELLAEEYRDRLDEQALEMLGDIQTQGRRMVSLMEDLLTLSRIGKLAIPTKPVAAGEIVDEVLHELDDLIKPQRAEVRVDDLPELQIPETLLFQVLANLIGNALRYAGTSAEPIEVGGQRTENITRIFVRDHGQGVEPEQAEKIFELFYRGKAHKGTSGTGLGLGIVKKIVEAFDGRAWVEPTPGGGATFYVEFPSQIQGKESSSP